MSLTTRECPEENLYRVRCAAEEENTTPREDPHADKRSRVHPLTRRSPSRVGSVRDSNYSPRTSKGLS